MMYLSKKLKLLILEPIAFKGVDIMINKTVSIAVIITKGSNVKLNRAVSQIWKGKII